MLQNLYNINIIFNFIPFIFNYTILKIYNYLLIISSNIKMLKINHKSLEKIPKYNFQYSFQLRPKTELIPLSRDKILSKFTQEDLDSCWEALSINIIQNYQRGKGTLIKGFGTFTFKGTEINLEGTTNEVFRDKKERKPIFLVSKEFNENLKTGEYTQQYGIRYFTTKENKNIPISNINYSEISFSLSMPKEKVFELIKHLIHYLSESITKKIFKNKVMPGLGVLILKQNILAVKFNKDFENNIKCKNAKLNKLKSNISLDREISLNFKKDFNIGNCPDIYNTSESIKATNSLLTECRQDAKRYLLNNYKIGILNANSFTISPSNKIFKNKRMNEYFYRNAFFYSNDHSFKLLNDSRRKVLSLSKNKLQKSEKTPRNSHAGQNPLVNLDDMILKTLSYFKGSMIKDSKDLDVNKTGSISKEDAVTMLMKNIPDIKQDLARQIVDHYFVTDQIDYMRFIALLIKGSNNCFLKKNYYFDFTKFLISKSIKNYSGNFSFSSKKKNFSFKDIIKKQKDKKIAIIHKADKEVEKNKEIEKQIKKNNEQKEMFFADKQKIIERNKKEILFITGLIPEIKNKYATFLDQNINSGELIRILNKHDLLYEKEKIDEILRFIEVKDINNFCLREFINKIQLCKLISTSIDRSEFSVILNQIKDILYIHGGAKFLFNNDMNKKNTIDSKTFIELLKDKSSLSVDKLKNAFYYIVKTNRDMNINDYNEYFVQKNLDSNIYEESYFINMMKKIIDEMEGKFMTPSEYFDYLLSFNISTQDKVINKLNWIKYLQLQKFNFNAEELDHFFNWIDYKKDNVIDLEEFETKYQYTIKPLTTMKNSINKNKLDIEDLAHRMKIDMEELKELDYQTFLRNLKKIDFTLPESFIKSIFDELKQKDKKSGKEYVESKKFLDEINYIKPPQKYQLFTQKYINTVRNKTTYEDLKEQFEKYDRDSLGRMTKLEFVTAMSHFFPEFNDDDHMRFVRIMEVIDKDNKIIYPELLNFIFYYNVNKMNDHFTKICEFLLKKLREECDNDVEKLMYLIETGLYKKAKSLYKPKPLTFKQIENFLNKSNIQIEKKVIMQLDLDSDGLFSYEDLYSILLRYRDTLYFKYYNNSNNPSINLFTKDVISQTKINVICEKLLSYIKLKNITPLGLFKKFDKDNNGLISNIEFNQGIKELLNINAALGDPFFAYLDYYNMGMIDFDTFMSRLNYLNENKLPENDRKEENEIIKEIQNFILKNQSLSDNEIFQILDKDCDGLIKYNDLLNFIKNNLEMSEKEISKSKIERIMMTLSLTKNLQIGFNDISEFIKICKENKTSSNLTEIFKITANQNLSQKKKNVNWINDIIVRFGMYVSEKYESIEEFFYDCVEPGNNKCKFSDFMKFHENHYDLFNNGFHLSKDELLSIFTSLDSQKKNYLTLVDFQNKLQYFNFYKKMHFDIKDFFQTNFKNGIDAFKCFFKDINDKENVRCFISLKEIFDGFESFFPKKYENNTILKYLHKYFNITLTDDEKIKEKEKKKDTIDFSEFNYIYFDKSEENEVFINNFYKDTKLIDNRENLTIKDNKKYYIENNFYYSNGLHKNKNNPLSTPFDGDPFLKFIRIINSSKYDINSFFEEAIKENNNNPIVNKTKFRNIIKKLNIGLTNIELDCIVTKCSKEIGADLGEKINLEKLQNIIKNENNYSELSKGIKNVQDKISEIKALIYKFYSTPILCFKILDAEQNGKIDFQKYRNLILDLYSKNEQPVPNFALIKNTFDTIDLRKDGMIDYIEWSKSFSMISGKLDLAFERYSNNINDLNIKNIKKEVNQLKQWENSDNIIQQYFLIHKNRKLIKNKLMDNNLIIVKNGNKYVNSDILILLIKRMLPNCKLSHMQWKMITNIGKRDNIDNLVCISEFFKLIEIATKQNYSKPYNSNNDFNKIYYGYFHSPHKTLNYSNNMDAKNNNSLYGNKTITITSRLNSCDKI